MIIILAILLCVLIITGLVIGRKEGYDKNIPVLTTVGSTVNDIINFQDHSTVIKKFIGDNGHTVILIHNTPADFQMWQPLYMYSNAQKRMGKKVPTMISFDITGSGTGWTSVPTSFYDANPANHAWSADMYIDNIKAIYDKFVRSGKIIVAGYGYGGFLGQLFALRYPNLIEHLHIWSILIEPDETVLGPQIKSVSEWCSRHTNINYLTLPTEIVNKMLCLWFDVEECGDIKQNSLEYVLTRKLILESCAVSLLQTDKLRMATDLFSMWAQVKTPFNVTVLAADSDNYTPMDKVKADVEKIRPYCSNVKLLQVQGKHAFVVKHSNYIFDLLTTSV